MHCAALTPCFNCLESPLFCFRQRKCSYVCGAVCQAVCYRMGVIVLSLFVSVSALVADSEEKLCRLVNEFDRVCERRKLRVNVGKSKVMRCSNNTIIQ